MPKLAWLLLAAASACSDPPDAAPSDAAPSRGTDAAPAELLDCAVYLDDPDGAPWSRDLVLCAAVVIGSCHGRSPREVISGVEFLREEEIRCLAAAGPDCDAAYACIGYAFARDEVCVDAQSRCDGDRAVLCHGGGTETMDCPTYFDPASHDSPYDLASGPACVEDPDSGALCAGRGACSASETTCRGDWLLSCVDSGPGLVWQGYDCSRYGWACVEEEGGARCSDGTAIPCSGGGLGCDASEGVITHCWQGFEARESCRIPTSDCIDGSSQCRLAEECNETGAEASTCEGGVLTFCVLGARYRVDCGAAGFDGCVTPYPLPDPVPDPSYCG